MMGEALPGKEKKKKKAIMQTCSSSHPVNVHISHSNVGLDFKRAELPILPLHCTIALKSLTRLLKLYA